MLPPIVPNFLTAGEPIRERAAASIGCYERTMGLRLICARVERPPIHRLPSDLGVTPRIFPTSRDRSITAFGRPVFRHSNCAAVLPAIATTSGSDARICHARSSVSASSIRTSSRNRIVFLPISITHDDRLLPQHRQESVHSLFKVLAGDCRSPFPVTGSDCL